VRHDGIDDRHETELIEHDRPRAWSERAGWISETTSWIHWFNTTRVHRTIGGLLLTLAEQYRHTDVSHRGEVCLTELAALSLDADLWHSEWNCTLEKPRVRPG